MNKKPVHVIAHTHWDRSWYWPFERFRLKLVECVKAVVRELKAHPDYQFNFDGQVLMLEDYLQVCPEDRAYLQDCARNGRIKIGPMYCLSDVYCTGGEALIRNILIGKQWCEAFGGGYSRVLHMPDTFGITPCMPMIAAGFGMQAFVFMRGTAGQVPGLVNMQNIQGITPQIPEDTRFFLWRSPDGSEIATIRLREGYASAAAGMGFDPAKGAIVRERYAERLIAAAREWDTPPHDVVLLMAGVDHQIPWEGQADSQVAATAASDYDFRFSSLDACAAQLHSTDRTAWPVCEDEFHGSGAASVLGGTVSTRIYLKQTNASIEQLLVNQVEPGAALALALGQTDPGFTLISHAWKTLLTTHPHDDICGCSVDAVHRKNESDMAQAWESADAIRRRAFFALMRHFGGNRRGDLRPAFTLFNFQLIPRTGPSFVRIDFEGQIEWGDIKLPDHYSVVNEAGESVPFREIRRGQSDQHPRRFVDLELFATLRPFVPERFYLEEMADEEIPAESATTFRAENARFAISLHPNGSFDLTDKASGTTRTGLGLLSSQGDIGDSYDFSDIPAETEQVFDQIACELSRRTYPGGVVELRASGELELPASTDSITRTRSAARVRLPYSVVLLVSPDAPALEVRIEFTNTAADHRLRWNLPLAARTATSLAGIKFTPITRPAGARPAGDTAPRIFPEHPADAFVAASGLACFGRFPVNYEIVDGPNGAQRLAVTICRSASYLTNPTQGATRPGTHAGPHTLVPEARCLGRTFQFSFALRAYEPEEAGNLLHHAALWRAQPLFGQLDATMPHPWRDRGDSAAASPLISAGGNVLVSSCKPAADGRGLILRLHNATATAQTITLHQSLAKSLMPVLLDETPEERPPIENTVSGVPITIPPYGLRSFRL